MFGSNEWKPNRFIASQGEKVASVVLDNRFCKNVILCLKSAAPLIEVLWSVGSDEKPAMGFLFTRA